MARPTAAMCEWMYDARSPSCTSLSAETSSSYEAPFSVTYRGGNVGYSRHRRTSSSCSPPGFTSQPMAVRGRLRGGNVTYSDPTNGERFSLAEGAAVFEAAVFEGNVLEATVFEGVLSSSTSF